MTGPWRVQARQAIVSIACGMCVASGPSLGLAASVVSSTPLGGGPLLQLQQAHGQCPINGSDARSMLIDSAGQWRGAVLADERAALGRSVRWRQERVLVMAMARQPTLGVSVSLSEPQRQPSGRGAPPRVSVHVARPAEGDMAQAALSRPCVFAVLRRGPWRAVWIDAEDGPWRVDLPGRDPGTTGVHARRPA